MASLLGAGIPLSLEPLGLDTERKVEAKRKREPEDDEEAEALEATLEARAAKRHVAEKMILRARKKAWLKTTNLFGNSNSADDKELKPVLSVCPLYFRQSSVRSRAMAVGCVEAATKEHFARVYSVPVSVHSMLPRFYASLTTLHSTDEFSEVDQTFVPPRQNWPEARALLTDATRTIFGIQLVDRRATLDHFELTIGSLTDPTVLVPACPWDLIRGAAPFRRLKVAVLCDGGDMDQNRWGDDDTKKKALVERITSLEPERHTPPLGYYLLELVNEDGSDTPIHLGIDEHGHLLPQRQVTRFKYTLHLDAFIRDLVAVTPELYSLFELLAEPDVDLALEPYPLENWVAHAQARYRARPKVYAKYPRDFVPKWPLLPVSNYEFKTPDESKSVRLETMPWPVDYSVFVDYEPFTTLSQAIFMRALGAIVDTIQGQWQDDPRNRAAKGLQFFARDFDVANKFAARAHGARLDPRSTRGLYSYHPESGVFYPFSRGNRTTWAQVNYEFAHGPDRKLPELVAQYMHFPEGSKQKHIVFWFEAPHDYGDGVPPLPFPGAGLFWPAYSPQTMLYQKLHRQDQLLVVRIAVTEAILSQDEFDRFYPWYSVIADGDGAGHRINIDRVLDALAEAQADRYAAGVTLPAIQRLHESSAARVGLSATEIQKKIMSNLGGRFAM